MFIEHLESAAANTRRRIYEQLWLELTIVGRDVWSRNDLEEGEKLDGLKLLNEIQHRVWGAHANAAGYSPSDLYATIQNHAAQASALTGIVAIACKRSLRVLSTIGPESE